MADNGKEFAGHETIKEQLNADVYFAHPYHSWERGLNENTNGLIRQYFTKGSSFENITDDEVEGVMNKLNHRPRKTLNFKTPHAVFFAELLQEAAWVLGLHFGVESTIGNIAFKDELHYRVLYFADGKFTTNDKAKLAWQRQDDNWWVSIDGREFYFIPDSLIYGG